MAAFRSKEYAMRPIPFPWPASSLALVLILVATLWPAPAAPREQGEPLVRARIPAFPGAGGAGAWTPGGRGGKVYAVTNLADRGSGSLREAVEASGPRTVVFRVAGIITLETPLAINHPFITIAGQTAPGDGICIRGQTTEINTHDVVLRYLRFRRGNLKSRDDALGGNPVGNVIVDHCSASWGLDENLSLYRHMVKLPGGGLKKLPVENLTIQWCISSEALDLNNHAFGGTWGGKNCSFHHNLFACNTGRNPSIGMGGSFDFRNNVLFNWRHRTIDGGDGSSRVNVVANYFKPGPATTSEALRYRICRAQGRSQRDEHPGFGKWYVGDNYVVGNAKVTADNWAGGVQYDPPRQDKDAIIPMGTEKDVRSFEPFPAATITQQKAEEAYELVLAYAGASRPHRDPVDVRIIETVRTGKPTFKTGIIDTPADVGGWPEYRAGAVDADSDGDGIPDWWEKKYGLNPNDPSDALKDLNGDGFTNLEKYLNGIDPRQFVDYTRPENNRNPYHKP
jgi:pectate lyase